MKLLIKEKVLDYEGKEIVGKEGDTPLTYFDVFATALSANMPGEVLTAEEKSRIYQCATKLFASKEPDFTVEQLSLIKERVGKVYNALVFGRVCDFIDGDKKPSGTAN